MITVPAGLLNERGGSVVVEDVLITPPGPGEVLVRVRAAGLCHTDLTARRDAPAFPLVLGHEGAGTIEQVGPDVHSLPLKTPVVLAWKVPCGICIWCRRGQQPWCEHPKGVASPRIYRCRDGAAVIPFLRAGTFCPFVVVPAEAAIPVPAELPFAEAALLGCGVATGVGAALFEAPLEPGRTVAVFGLGGVGLNVVQGAALAQAGSIIAIDLRQDKLEMAPRFGATVTVRGGEDVVALVREITGGRGVDVAFEVVGRPEVMTQALDVLAPGGTLILVGAAARDETLSFAPRRFMSRQQTIRGCIYGACRPVEHFPLFAHWALEGKLRVRDLITRTLNSLDEVNDAFAALAAGDLVRAVLLFPEDV